MCRYVAYLGPVVVLSELVYRPTNGLVHQAREAMQSSTRINADGFGVAWYSPEISPEPAVFKDTSPVWNNRNLGSIADRIRSSAIVAHIRSASSYDPVTHENCHPFQRGRLLWMHNGDIPGRARLSRQVNQAADDTLLAQIRGNTDSELAFTLFLTHLRGWPETAPSLNELNEAMRSTLAEITAWHRQAGDERPLELNFCITDGAAVVAARFAVSNEPCPTLHWLDLDNGRGRTVYIASEPLFENPRWRPADNGDILLATREGGVERQRLGEAERA